MNGFILFTKGHGLQNLSPERIAPLNEGTSYDLKQFGDSGCLLTWGNTGGDIRTAGNGDQAILILSGYIAEIESGPTFQTQEEAARYLLAQFMRDTSDMALEHLLSRTYGSFSIVFRDQARDVTMCVTDRISSRPVWRCREGSRWVVSTHAAAIALSMKNPQIDLAGVGAFMLYGAPVTPSSSLFQGVEAIPAGSIVRFDSNGKSNLSRWYRFQHREESGVSPKEWAELAADRVVRAATRIDRSSRKPAVFFSGGTDSRLTASAMKSAGSDPLLVTLADSVNLEVRVAKLASKALGLEHEVIIRDRHWYLRTLPSDVYETGGTYVWTHGHFSTAADVIQKKHGVDVFLLGDFCEAFSKLLCVLERSRVDVWTAEEFTRVFDSIRLPLYRPHNRAATLSLFNKKSRKQIEENLGYEIRERFNEVSSLANDPLIVGDLYFRWETVTASPTFFMFLDLRSMSSERNLMFDRDVHQLLEMLPSKMRNCNNFGASVIKRLQPMAAWVVNSNSLMPMIWPPVAHKMSKRVKPMLGKARRSLICKTHCTTGSWPEHHMLYASDPMWKHYFEKNFENEEMFDETVFDIMAIRRFREEFSNGRINRSADIEKLVQIGLLCQMLRRGASNVVQETPIWNDRMTPHKP